MISFFICLALLIGGYFVYGSVVERTFGPDDRETPAVKINDGVDYMVLPQWKLFMIQLLNIAGLGPIFGALSGALWGPVVFLWITFGTIFAGAVHDYFSGMLSERNNGASISEISGIYLGGTMKNVMRVFSVVLLVMVGTCDILFIDYPHMFKRCENACTYHSTLVYNMLGLLSDKAQSLSERVDVLSRRSIRDKLLCYFRQQTDKAGTTTFLLPFSFSVLADYIATDRSAMMRELRHLKEEGLLATDGRQVTLLAEPIN